jgi:hypothetical protein
MLESPPAVAVKVRRNISYGHSIVFDKNLALWPLEFKVSSEIMHEHQLEYGRESDRRHWSFNTSLLPDQGDERVTLLLCLMNEIGREELSTLVESNAGKSERLVLEVDIE